VKLDNLVHVAHNVHVGEHSAFAALVGVAGSTTLGRHTRLGGQVGVVGHLELADNISVTAASAVLQSVGRPGDTLMGVPAGPQREVAKQWSSIRRLPELLRRVREMERTLASIREAGRVHDG